jgi:hypothetical protein
MMAMVYFTVALMSRKNFRRVTVSRDGFTADYFAPEGKHIHIEKGGDDSFVFVGTYCIGQIPDFRFAVRFGHVEDIRYSPGDEKEWEIVLSDNTAICLEPED